MKLSFLKGAALLLLVTASAQAETPRVLFDVKPVVGCVDVTTPEFSAVNPNERLIELKIEISSLIEAGVEADITQYFYQIECVDRDGVVANYLPKTTTASHYAGPIAVEQREEDVRSVGVNATGTFDLLVKGTASADVASKDYRSVKYELLPPQEQLVASGTTSRGRGVYFKLKPSPHVSIEGGRDFFVVLRVPLCWRTGELRVSCEAIGMVRSVAPMLDDTESSGAARFSVALYLDGDLEAKAAAAEFSQAETELRQQIYTHRQGLRRSAYPNAGYRLGAALGVVSSQLPRDWLHQTLSSPQGKVAEQLPPPIRTAAARYAAAKQGFLELH
ncbi:hypothetical protein [Lignipirellula cremea]|uniref:Uncharacterized protein n=1 Tax=Lignipirellula cremea TaxID=2528010 RepID=A0A518DQ96_9BACT|nr:hypothetical protein [Lignipirellula cremea]QDU93984.1 hypothetical protein Pla8534_17700 [Lignipirellula cremea]